MARCPILPWASERGSTPASQTRGDPEPAGQAPTSHVAAKDEEGEREAAQRLSSVGTVGTVRYQALFSSNPVDPGKDVCASPTASREAAFCLTGNVLWAAQS